MSEAAEAIGTGMSAPAPPAGTVTFLFTDIGGSSRLWERAPDDMRVALAAHDAMLRTSIGNYEGFVFKTVGDAFCAAFTRPQQAVSAAIDAQRRLARDAWPDGIDRIGVRMAVHTGTTIETAGDYFGPTVNRVARLLAIAAPGQILVSSASATLLRDTLPTDVELRSLGTMRLRDLRQPEPTYQVVVPDLPATFPAVAAPYAHANNLPFQLSSFVGRADEVVDLVKAIASHRLVTVVGPGGIGKTRLALKAADAVLDRFEDGLWLVALSPIQDPLLIAQALAVVLDVHEQPNATLDDTIADFIGTKSLLLIFDSAEHLIAATAAFAKHLLSRCANVHIVVTSREPLHLAGESVLRLRAMIDAPALFRERALENDPTLTFDAHSAEHISEICRRVDGIPLAIELAAAHVATLPIADIASRLGTRLDLLVSRDPTIERRHRTLRATLDWSYDLLAAEEVTVLRTLAVFEGAFDIESVAAVGAFAPELSLNAVESLALKSLVSVERSDDASRYALLDTVREYLTGLMSRDGSISSLRERHFEHYRGIARGFEGVGNPKGEVWLSHVEAAISNVRAALDWALHHRPADGAVVAVEMSSYWKTRGFLREGRMWFDRFLAEPSVEGSLRADLLRRAATFATEQDDYDRALTLTLECKALYEAAGDPHGVAEAVHNLAVIEQRSGRLNEAREHYAFAVEKFRETSDRRAEGIALYNLALIALSHDDEPAVTRLADEAMVAAEAAADSPVLANIRSLLGILAARRSDFDEAIRLFDEALEVMVRMNDHFNIAQVSSALATVYARLRQLEKARDYARTCVRIGLEINATSLLIYGFEVFSEIEIAEGEFTAALVHYAKSRELRQSHNYLHTSIRRPDDLLSMLRDHFGAELDRFAATMTHDNVEDVARKLVTD